MTFVAQVSFDDPDATYHDREDGRTYVFRRSRGEIEDDVTVPVEFELILDPEDAAGSELLLEAMNDDDGLEVDLSKLIELPTGDEDQV